MAGKLKHMERSHRSYGKNHAVLGEIRRKAVAKKNIKDIKKKHGFIDLMKRRFFKQKAD